MNLKDQLEREKASHQATQEKNESLLHQKAELLHKISQLQDKLKDSDEAKSSLEKELLGMKSKHESLVNTQYASASEKLNKLASQLEEKEEEIKVILQDKSNEIHQLKTVLDAKQAQIAKANVAIESKDSKIKTLEKTIKSLESELKNKSKELVTFEFSTKNDIESSVNDKKKVIDDLKHDLALKRVRLAKQEQKLAEVTKTLEETQRDAEKNQRTLQDNIKDLQKLNTETAEMYKSQLHQKENELISLKQDLNAQRNRVYTAIEEVKSQLGQKIAERDIAIEQLKTALSKMHSKTTPAQSQEKHWVIEANLRDIISEHKQQLISYKAKLEKSEKELELFKELLVKTKVSKF